MSTEFGKRLVAARTHAKLTQTELAERVQMAQSTLAAAESKGYGSRKTPQLAAACGVSPHWLATGEGEMLSPAMVDHTAAMWNNADKQQQQNSSPVRAVVTAMAMLGPLLQAVDEETKELVLGAVQRWAHNPSDGANSLRNIARLLGDGTESPVQRIKGLPADVPTDRRSTVLPKPIDFRQPVSGRAMERKLGRGSTS